jgi:hypothetical protein
VSVVVRAFVVIFGAACVFWGAVTIPVFWRDMAIQTTSGFILQGHRYSTSALDSIVAQYDPGISSFCRAPTLRGIALVRFSLVENALVDGDRARIDQRLTDLNHSVVNLFACDPTGSFFWLAYYWGNLSTDGYRPEYLKFLRMSYQQGPTEGWIATKRSRLALAIYPELPPDLAERAITEFAGIVASGFIVDAAAILTGPGWPIRDQLLASLENVGLPERERLSSQLRERGYDVAVPGVASALRRPFEH